MESPRLPELPGLNCGVCGYRTCGELAGRLVEKPDMIKRCIYLAEENLAPGTQAASAGTPPSPLPDRPRILPAAPAPGPAVAPPEEWRDSLGRELDFILEHFPEDPGPREIILPHNPMITREMDLQPGDILIGRPLGMSCGCPITHCGVVMDVDPRTGVLTWCVTGPLGPREKGFKDLGFYIAEAYEGLVRSARCELRIGMRYFFQPRMCMLQWRHSGLINYLNRTPQGDQVRVEGLWIG